MKINKNSIITREIILNNCFEKQGNLICKVCSDDLDLFEIDEMLYDVCVKNEWSTWFDMNNGGYVEICLERN